MIKRFLPIFSRFSLLLLAIFLFACSTQQPIIYSSDDTKKIEPKSLETPSYTQDKRKIDDQTDIAVLLPFNHPSQAYQQASLALQKALLYAYFKDTSNASIELHFYDSYQNEQTLISTYNQIIRDGNDLVIGPLSEKNVQTLIQKTPQKHLPLPTIALNLPKDKALKYKTISNLYFMSLSNSFDIAQIAQRAYDEGYRQPLVLYQDTAWGQKMSDYFIKQWNDMGEIVSGTATFHDHKNIAKSISLLTDVSLNKIRDFRVIQRELDRELKKNPDFIEMLLPEAREEYKIRLTESSRRPDADFVVYIGNHEYAKQVKPFFAFYLSNDLKIYALNQVYKPDNSPQSNQDLNTISFPDIPFLHIQDQDRQILKHYNESNFADYGRIYALGIDLYDLSKRIIDIEALPLSTKNLHKLRLQVNGKTGLLSLSLPRNIFIREHTWLKFIKGNPEPIYVLEPKPETPPNPFDLEPEEDEVFNNNFNRQQF